MSQTVRTVVHHRKKTTSLNSGQRRSEHNSRTLHAS